VVFGTGAMASYFGGRIAGSGRASVTLAGAWQEALAVLSASGVRVEEDAEDWTTPIDAVALADAPTADLVLILVKSHKTRGIAPHVARAMGAAGIAVSLQNGIGNAETLGALIDPSRLVMGVTRAGATLLSAGHVRGFAGPTILGRDKAGHALRVAELLSTSALPTTVDDDVDALIWRKLAVNCAINPLSALRGIPNGALLQRAEDRQLLEAAAYEVQAVARARGVRVDGDYREAALGAARLTAGNRSSMLQDVDRKAPTEIEALNGAVVREGARLAVPTPTNARLLEEIRARETAYRAAPAASRP
jgi:2-dehydropantoate 2-reductase